MRSEAIALVSSVVLAASCGRPSDARSAGPAPTPPSSSALTIPPPSDASASDDEELTEPISDAGTVSPRQQYQLSPAVTVRGAIARTPPIAGGERALVLLRSPAQASSCLLSSDDPEIVMMSCHWQAGGSCVSQSLSFKDGGTTNFRARLKVLDAPTQKGARGRIQIEQSDDTNVHGGTVEVLVCD
jgi:hypothetical protein